MKNEKDTALQRVEAGADELAVSCSPEQTGEKKEASNTTPWLRKRWAEHRRSDGTATLLQNDMIQLSIPAHAI